jgi:pimeloyl-ACP methyl ester carboxylesterase
MRATKILRFVGGFLLVVVAALILFILYLTFRPLNLDTLTYTSQPATTYEEAMTRIAEVQARDDDTINPLCHSIAMTHGEKVENVIVFYHGYTNCPEQFRVLGETLFEQGYNVLIPRMPHHGLTDRMTDDQQNLTTEELITWGSEAIDIAQGLGEQVSVSGISGGGVLTSWIAQMRSDVDVALAIAPTFSYKQVPSGFVTQFTNFAYTIPNMFVWWDPALQENAPGPTYGYPRFATRAVAGVLRLGLATQTLARDTAPLAQRIIVTTNPNDLIVDDGLVTTAVESWRSHGATVEIYTFSTDLEIGHDIIDQYQPDQQTAVVYPIIVGLITGE